MTKAKAKQVIEQLKNLEEKLYVLSCGDAETILSRVSDETVNATITSPPYFRRKDYATVGQIGAEPTLEAYIQRIKALLGELYRVTVKDGACFLVIGDTYDHRALALVPQRVALSALEIGWIVRNEIIWSKLDPSPDGARNRWRESHETIFFLTKSRSAYKFRADRIRVPYSKKTLKRWGKGQMYDGPKATRVAGPRGQRVPKGKKFILNPRGCIPKDVICMATACNHNKHYASFPEPLVEQFLLAVTDPKDIVLDPFAGTSTTGVAAVRNARFFWGIDINPKYIEISAKRLRDACSDNSYL